MKTLGTLFLLGALGTGVFAQDAGQTAAQSEASFVVKYLRCPDGGVRPVVERDGLGNIHIVYHTGFSPAADLYYMQSSDGGIEFSTPIRVNATDGGVDASDFSRGASLAVGRDGRPFVVWTGSEKSAERGPDGETPLMFTRLADDQEAFEPARNLLRTRWGLRATPGITADANGNVYVFWHAPDDDHPEDVKYNDRVVYWTQSSDGGQTFSESDRIDERKPKGVSANSSLNARIDEDGTIYVFFRAGQTKQKDMRLLYRPVTSPRFGSSYVDTWRRMRPPQAMSALKAGHDRLVLCWETEGQVFSAMISRQTNRNVRPLSPMAKKRHLWRTRVVSTFSGLNVSIMAWMEGVKDEPPTRLAWRLFDNGTYGPIDRGFLDDVPADAVPDVFVRADGGFTVVY